jgi:hypothetical protein
VLWNSPDGLAALDVLGNGTDHLQNAEKFHPAHAPLGKTQRRRGGCAVLPTTRLALSLSSIISPVERAATRFLACVSIIIIIDGFIASQPHIISLFGLLYASLSKVLHTSGARPSRTPSLFGCAAKSGGIYKHLNHEPSQILQRATCSAMNESMYAKYPGSATVSL